MKLPTENHFHNGEVNRETASLHRTLKLNVVRETLAVPKAQNTLPFV